MRNFRAAQGPLQGGRFSLSRLLPHLAQDGAAVAHDGRIANVHRVRPRIAIGRRQVHLRTESHEKFLKRVVLPHGLREVGTGQVTQGLPRSVQPGLVAERVARPLQEDAPQWKNVGLAQRAHESTPAGAGGGPEPRRHTTHTYIGSPESRRMMPQYTVS